MVRNTFATTTDGDGFATYYHDRGTDMSQTTPSNGWGFQSTAGGAIPFPTGWEISVPW
jgi:hypothetical protein